MTPSTHRAARAPHHSTAGAPPCAGFTEAGARCAVERPQSSSSVTARLALAFALVLAGTFSAEAQDSVSWGEGVTFDVHLVPKDGPGHVADLVGVNRMTFGVGEVTQAVLSIEGLTVTVTVYHGPGMAPDRMSVIVPDDHLAVPEWVDIEENDTATIRIFRLSDMVMG
jgi:hypothetical protein